MHLRLIFISLTSLGILISCQTSGFRVQNLRDRSYYKKDSPPGTVPLSNNLFIDQSEVTNLSYSVFLYWQKRVFGEKSLEYTTVLPDQNVWTKVDHCLLPHADYYLFHSAYRDFPVVGISQKQALSFAKWRADRILEFILIKAKVFEDDPLPTNESYFSIEKYFLGQYKNIVPDTSFLFPTFSLPTLENYKTAIQLFTQKNFHSNIKPCINDSLKANATIYYYWPDKKAKDGRIYNLKGNVREWLNDPDISFGGGWTDSLDVVLNKDTFISTSVNAWTGFRLTSKWSKWNTNAP